MDGFEKVMAVIYMSMFISLSFMIGTIVGTDSVDLGMIGIMMAWIFIMLMFVLSVLLIKRTELGRLCDFAIILFMVGIALLVLPFLTMVGTAVLIWYLIDPLIHGGIVLVLSSGVFALLCKGIAYVQIRSDEIYYFEGQQ